VCYYKSSLAHTSIFFRSFHSKCDSLIGKYKLATSSSATLDLMHFHNDRHSFLWASQPIFEASFNVLHSYTGAMVLLFFKYVHHTGQKLSAGIRTSASSNCHKRGSKSYFFVFVIHKSMDSKITKRNSFIIFLYVRT
jgi:hypothetical protein